MLTAKQIVERGIVYLSEDNAKKYGIRLCPAQAGVDLHIISCAKLKEDSFGIIYPDNAKDAEGKPIKTKICKTEPMTLCTPDEFGAYWMLEEGDYEIGFAEGCKFDAVTAGKIVHRSSVRRNGEEINSPLWDPGFYTNEMGTFMHVNHRIRIYLASRVAQMIVFESKEEADMYNGQYQGTGVLNGQH